MGDQHMGLQARLNVTSTAVINLHKLPYTFIFINQIRIKKGEVW